MSSQAGRRAEQQMNMSVKGMYHETKISQNKFNIYAFLDHYFFPFTIINCPHLGKLLRTEDREKLQAVYRQVERRPEKKHSTFKALGKI